MCCIIVSESGFLPDQVFLKAFSELHKILVGLLLLSLFQISCTFLKPKKTLDIFLNDCFTGYVALLIPPGCSRTGVYGILGDANQL